MNQITQKYLIDLKKSGDKKRAENDIWYHKSSREHWGVTSPKGKILTKKYSNELNEEELISLAEELWKTDIFDAMTAATGLLAHKKVKGSKMLWNLVKKFMKQVDGWCLEDNLARSAWKCIEADESRLDDLEKWLKTPNFWRRRAVLIFTLPYAKPGKDPERMLGWAAKLSSDHEWFIQKAIGWWLRDLGEHNPQRVVSFLNKHGKGLKYVARKESTRKLPDKWKKKVLFLNS